MPHHPRASRSARTGAGARRSPVITATSHIPPLRSKGEPTPEPGRSDGRDRRDPVARRLDGQPRHPPRRRGPGRPQPRQQPLDHLRAGVQGLAGRQWQPHHYTVLFFHDEAVSLAAGHRPCALCRREAYDAYRNALADHDGATTLNGQGPRRTTARRAPHPPHQDQAAPRADAGPTSPPAPSSSSTTPPHLVQARRPDPLDDDRLRGRQGTPAHRQRNRPHPARQRRRTAEPATEPQVADR